MTFVVVYHTPKRLTTWRSRLARPGARPMDLTGRPLRGFVFVDAEQLVRNDVLAQWVERGRRFAESLPKKA